MNQEPHRIEELIKSLEQQRDELSVKINLAGMELRDEWDRIDAKLTKLSAKYDPLKDAVGETADDVWDALKELGGEVATGFKRIRASLKKQAD
ncbi:MAG: hypothetical protein ISQ06_05515 [Planctomycetaceae bacterium]|nr:hypothetical protein [Planctomycetaceae bacterium]